jgi:hypothetical protein
MTRFGPITYERKQYVCNTQVIFSKTKVLVRICPFSFTFPDCVRKGIQAAL